MLRLSGIFFGLAAAAVPAAVSAGPPPASFILYNFSATVNGYKPGNFSGPDFTASLTTLPSLSLVTTASSDIRTLYEQQYIGSVLVWGEVTGPASTTIPIDVNYSESDFTSITPGGYADVQSDFVFYDGVNTVAVAPINIIGYTSGSQSESGTYTMSVQTDTPFYVEMQSTNTLYAPSFYYGVGETASAYLDPMIYIDPSFAQANPGYSVAISAGIQNIGPSSAPEPGTWALMLLGVAGLGAVRRGARRSTHAAPSQPCR